ncbi:unnamed protein product, partial [Symbiodinium sp. KB8]
MPIAKLTAGRGRRRDPTCTEATAVVHERLKRVFFAAGELDLRAQQHVTKKVCVVTAHPPHLVRRREMSSQGARNNSSSHCIISSQPQLVEDVTGTKARGRRPPASQVHLESDLCMPGCNQIPVAAWQQLEGATWRKLTKVDFRQCFDKESKGIEAAAGLLAALARCPELQELQMSFCSEIPAAAWQQLQGATWPKLTKVEVDQCFGENSKGADGVAGLLTALARCAELKD